MPSTLKRKQRSGGRGGRGGRGRSGGRGRGRGRGRVAVPSPVRRRRDGGGGRGVHNTGNSGSGSIHSDSNQYAAADAEVQTLKENVVVEASRDLYLRNNIKLISFFFDDRTYRNEILYTDMIHSLQAAQAEDAVTGTTRQSSKSAFRIVLSNALNEYKSFDSHPVKVELITFTHFSCYISYRI